MERERFDSIDEAISALRRRAEAIVAQGPLPPVSGFKDFAPGDRVAARLELTARTGPLRRREAGIDVRGDGSMVAYSGAIRKQVLEPAAGRTVFDEVGVALAV